MHRHLKIILRYMIPVIIILTGVPLLQKTAETDEPFTGDTLRCAIAINAAGKGMSYPIGYNYEMLKLFAGHLNKTAEIFLSDRFVIDSLQSGNVDIVVYPYSDTLVANESYFSSIPLADSSSWIMDGGKRQEHKIMNIWLSRFFLSDRHKRIADRFTPFYNPYSMAGKGRIRSTLSPYDDLFRKNAAELGWDRETLTALVWQESRFRIEARSARGAIGLMQMMPRTADRFSANDMLDPEENMAAAVRYLKHLQNMFRDKASDNDELQKMTLAAYNAGEGRIMDCIAYAISTGRPYSTWKDIVAVIPDMREESILDADTVKLGIFKGYETIAYVDKVLSISNLFREIGGK